MAEVASYTGRDIQVLEGLDPVRKRPGMYIGGTGKPGLHRLLWEIVDNAVDEATNGYASSIEVILHKDGKSITEVAVDGVDVHEPVHRHDIADAIAGPRDDVCRQNVLDIPISRSLILGRGGAAREYDHCSGDRDRHQCSW